MIGKWKWVNMSFKQPQILSAKMIEWKWNRVNMNFIQTISEFTEWQYLVDYFQIFIY
jgi:hypothetical protein